MHTDGIRSSYLHSLLEFCLSIAGVGCLFGVVCVLPTTVDLRYSLFVGGVPLQSVLALIMMNRGVVEFTLPIYCCCRRTCSGPWWMVTTILPVEVFLLSLLPLYSNAFPLLVNGLLPVIHSVIWYLVVVFCLLRLRTTPRGAFWCLWSRSRCYSFFLRSTRDYLLLRYMLLFTGILFWVICILRGSLFTFCIVRTFLRYLLPDMPPDC